MLWLQYVFQLKKKCMLLPKFLHDSFLVLIHAVADHVLYIFIFSFLYFSPFLSVSFT